MIKTKNIKKGKVSKRNKTITIRSTKQYGKFKRLDANRGLSDRNISNLMESYKITGGMSPSKPIIVDKNYNIIDGQNRFEACKKMNIPVYYIVSNDTVESIPVFNTYQEKWKTEDYFNYYTKLHKNENYERVLKIKDRCHVTLSGILSALDSRNNRSIKNGTFVFNKDIEKSAEYVEEILNFCYKIRHKKNISRKICIALNFLNRKKSFSYELLKEKINERPQKVHTCDSANDYIDMFLDIYNYRSRNKISRLDIEREYQETKRAEMNEQKEQKDNKDI